MNFTGGWLVNIAPFMHVELMDPTAWGKNQHKNLVAVLRRPDVLCLITLNQQKPGNTKESTTLI